MGTNDKSKDVAATSTPRPAATIHRATILLDRFDFVLAALVILFAFLVAFFPARNSDFLQQLATGRLIVEGKYSFGSDPFTVAGDQTGWVNHSWFYALTCYLIYRLPGVGPELVVVVKALLVACMATVMLLLRQRPGQRLYSPLVITALAVLSVSFHVPLQPVILSYFFLALTLFLLEYPRRLRERDSTALASTTTWWLIPALCVVWVNTDQWF